ncbi:MAG: hypothetical protein O7A04_11605 [Acidobacteria bacterium]|nr:hypothetical protein [Acidobacteriota bacterium]
MQSPTFVTLWIGNSDVLEAALSGIVVEGITLTPVADFEADFRALADALAATGADLAFANLPGVTAIPFVNTQSAQDPGASLAAASGEAQEALGAAARGRAPGRLVHWQAVAQAR